ncbi:MAG: anti-sigma F factor [Clostridiales bacterium]|nr:anti-sigma F factor [Clostridiales bacterium]
MNKNFMEVSFKAISINEGFARIVVSGFCLQLNPSVDELDDIKTAVSEAVTNCVVHAYPQSQGIVYVRCTIEGNEIKIIVKDNGVGIKDIKQAREPFFTSKPQEERSGMGFTVMESFMDKVEVSSNEGNGLVVVMHKKINGIVAKVENA